MINHLAKWMQDSPEAPFIMAGNRKYSNSEIIYLAVDRAESLRRAGCTSNKRAVLYSPDPFDGVELFLACQITGSVFIPVPTSLPAADLHEKLNTLKPDVICCHRKDRSLFRFLNIPVISLEEQSPGSGACETGILPSHLSKDDVSVMLFTSGSSGKPKPVQLTNGNFIASYRGWNELIHFTQNDEYLCCLPFHHVGGLSIFTRAILGRFPIRLSRKFQPDKIMSYLSSGDVTLTSLVPSMIFTLIQDVKENPFHKNVRAIIMGGSAMSEEMENRCLELDLPIVKSYGMTETCSGISGFFLRDAPEKRRSSGRPFGNTKVFTSQNRIVINGEQVMKGYLGETLRDGEFFSQDTGYLDKDGYLFVQGRLDDVIISGGENIRLSEIESVVNRHPWVRESAAVGIPDERWGEKLGVAVVMKDNVNFPPTEGEIKENLSAFLRDFLSDYQIPKIIIRLGSLPVTELGKPDKSRLIQIILNS